MREKLTSVAAAILAGGKNSRLGGRNKAFVNIEGTAIIQRTVGILKDIFKEVMIVTNSAQDFTRYENRVIITQDLIKDAGPLGGIYSGLSVTSKEAVFFVACDMPFLHNAMIKNQLSCFSKIDCDCLVPRTGSFIEPLHAIYRKKLKNDIKNFLDKGRDRSIKGFLETLNTYYWQPDKDYFNKDAFKNINTWEDLKKARQHAKGGYRGIRTVSHLRGGKPRFRNFPPRRWDSIGGEYLADKV